MKNVVGIKKALLISFLAVVPVFAVAGQGGGAGPGGGNIQPERLASTDDIAYSAKYAQWAAHYVLNHMAFFANSPAKYEEDPSANEKTACYEHHYSPAVLKRTWQKMFADNSEKIWPVYLSTPVEIKSSEPCFDKGVPKDGSYDPIKKVICISPYNMTHAAPGQKRRQPIVLERVETKVVGIYLHELSHALGANEEEACTITANYEDNGQMSFTKLEKAVKLTKDVLLGLDSQLQNLASSQVFFGASDDQIEAKIGRTALENYKTMICTAIPFASGAVEKLGQVAFDDDMDMITLSSQSIIQIATTGYLINIATQECVGMIDPKVENENFGGNDSVSLFDFSRSVMAKMPMVLPPYKQAEYSSIKILRPERADLQAELSAIRAAEKLVEDAYAIEAPYVPKNPSSIPAGQ